MPPPSQKPPAVRRYGKPPFVAALIHGGPGAPGAMAPVARVLARTLGVVEPWQTADSVAGQVKELAAQIDARATPPVTLVGHSWGAWLALLLAAEKPALVRGLILVGCAPLSPRYATEVRKHRRARLTRTQWREFETLEHRLTDPSIPPSSEMLSRLGELAQIADSYEFIAHPPGKIAVDPATFRAVWLEAEAMRRSGALLTALRQVKAPVLVLHGDADPHPLEGVLDPLRRAGVDPRSVLIKRCGHEPWWERYARERFFLELRTELDRASSYFPAEDRKAPS